MGDNKGILNFWSTAFKHLGPLKDYPALFFAALFVLVTIPLLIFGDPAKIVMPMALLVVLAVFSLYTHLIKQRLYHQHSDEPAMITATIKAITRQMADAVSVPKPYKPVTTKTILLSNFSSFWDQDEGAMVTVEGTLSRFAPFIIGPHKLKRDEHLKFRKKIEQLEQQGKSPGPSANAVLSFTAGQMVWRPNLPDATWEYLGLYQSIVRNSIPVFIEKEYFSTIKSELFGNNRYAVDVKITGQVKRLPKSFEEAIDKRDEQVIRPEINLWGNQAPLGLYVDENESIIPTGPARYLDGDIWVAVGKGPQEKFVSRFLDLSDAEDIAARLQELREEVKFLPKDLKVTSIFDSELWEKG